MAKTIEAKLRIAADLTEAIKALRTFHSELQATKKSAEQPADLQLPGANSADEIKRRDDAQRKADQARKKGADDALRDTRRLAYEQRQLGMQLTDIAVGLSTGQSPFYVLLQQGGQLRDMFGGVGGAARALLSTLTPVRLGVGALAAVIGAVAVSAIKGRNESEDFRKSLALTGNAAGTTAGQFDEQARDIADRQKAAISGVRETLGSLVATGNFTGETLRSAGRAATALAKLTGDSGAAVAKQFDGMGDDVAAWALKANRAYNFLNVEQFKYVQSLQAQGRTHEAARIVLEALANTIEARAVPTTDKLDRVLNRVKLTLASVADQWRGVFRDDTFEQRVDRAKAKLAELQRAQAIDRGGRRRSTSNALIDAARTDLAVSESDTRQDRMLADRQAATAREEQDKQLRETKAFQDLLTNVLLAGLQRRLAERSATLDREQATVDRQFAREEINEEEHSKRTIAISRRRLRAELDALEEQRKVEAGRKVDKLGDEEAKQAVLLQLDGQLAKVRSSIAVADEQLRTLADSSLLARSREATQNWLQLWQRASDQARQFALENAAAKSGDPVAQADAEARAKLDGQRRQLQQLSLDVQNQLDVLEGTALRAEQDAAAATTTAEADRLTALAASLRALRPELVEQLESLGRDGAKALERGFNQASFAALQGKASDALERISLAEANITAQVEKDKITTTEAERAKAVEREKEIAQLERLLVKLQLLAESDAEKNTVEQLRQKIVEMKDTMSGLEKTLRGSFKSSFQTFFNDIATGSESAGSAFRKFLAGVAQSMLDLISRNLGEKLLTSILEAFKGAGSAGGGSSGGGDFWAAAIKWFASLFHSGGVVGSGGGARRPLPAAGLLGALAFAPRYHSGGIVGLAADEEMAILRKGEEVLTASDPRHVRNARTAPVVGSLHVNVSMDGGTGTAQDEATARAMVRMVESKVSQGIAQEMRPGGLLESWRDRR